MLRVMERAALWDTLVEVRKGKGGTCMKRGREGIPHVGEHVVLGLAFGGEMLGFDL